jgi:hypothetical protein
MAAGHHRCVCTTCTPSRRINHKRSRSRDVSKWAVGDCRLAALNRDYFVFVDCGGAEISAFSSCVGRGGKSCEWGRGRCGGLRCRDARKLSVLGGRWENGVNVGGCGFDVEADDELVSTCRSGVAAAGLVADHGEGEGAAAVLGPVWRFAWCGVERVCAVTN